MRVAQSRADESFDISESILPVASSEAEPEFQIVQWAEPFPGTRPLQPFIARPRCVVAAIFLLSAGCSGLQQPKPPPPFLQTGSFGETTRVLNPTPGVTATIVLPKDYDPTKRVELILYALPNGNTTAETIGRRMERGPEGRPGWRFDIQHIGAQTRALRSRGLSQVVVAYLEADTKSWPEWRRVRGYDVANVRILGVVDAIRSAIRTPAQLAVTLTGHSGGGSFIWGFLEGAPTLPSWLERIAFLDANYSFEPRHGDKISTWLQGNPNRTLVVLAYDDREIMLDGKKVVSDSGGTYRATQRMLQHFGKSSKFTEDKYGEFMRYRAPQIEMLVHPNPENKILHTLMIGEMNGYMHAMLTMRPAFADAEPVLRSRRAYERFLDDR